MFLNRNQTLYLLFWCFGLLNNVLYVVILSAAMDIVGPAIPKSLVLLVDILPSLIIKATAPFFIHLIPYSLRIISLILLSSVGMFLVSFKSSHIYLLGIILASLSSGFGEITFLQLTHKYKEHSLNGWSSGTGGAGLCGSGVYMLLTSFFGIPVRVSLLVFAVLPFGFLLFFCLENNETTPNQEVFSFMKPSQNDDSSTLLLNSTPSETSRGNTRLTSSSSIYSISLHLKKTFARLKALALPFMIPLTTVYLFEYLINQSVSPTLLFPIDETQPKRWFNFKKYRDFYVTYGTLYQLGVFISRSSASFIRIRGLYFLAFLQGINFLITTYQSLYYVIHSPILLFILIFYEGLLGGTSYVNTFLNVHEEVPREELEFALGSVSIADSFGVFVASIIGLKLESSLCNHQVKNGRPWCTLE